MAIPVITSATYGGGNVGTAFSYQIVATGSPTSYDAFITPSGLPAGLSVNTSTGLISGTPTLQGNYVIHLRATNGDGTGQANLGLHLKVAGAPWVTSEGPTSGTVGTPFTFQITGSNTPTSFGVQDPALLPPGTTVNGLTGVISGTPTLSGSYSPEQVVGNSSGSDKLRLDIIISGGSSIPVITNTDLNDEVLINESYSFQITATNTPDSYDATPLPAGVSINSVDGLISGTPTEVGVFNVELSATNVAGTGTAQLTLIVQAEGGGDPPPSGIIPTGVACFMPADGPIDDIDIVLNDPAISIISVGQSWHQMEPVQGAYDFSYLRDILIKVAPSGKKVMLRPRTGSGSQSTGGRVPDYVLTLMGVDPTDLHSTPGVTYTFDAQQDSETTCFPVWWDPIFHARKKALYEALGDYLTNTTELTPAEKDCFRVLFVAVCNARTEDWNVPDSLDVETTGGPDGDGYPISELDRWLNEPDEVDPDQRGAGYTPQKIIDLGVTDADDGIIDVCMNSFPGKAIGMATNRNKVQLDDPDNGGDEHYVARTITDAAYVKYPGRWITLRNNVSTIMPVAAVSSGTSWEMMGDWFDLGRELGGQALDAVWGDTADSGGTGYRMNGGVDTDPDGILPPPLTAAQVLRKSAEKLDTYSPYFYEVYLKDCENQDADTMLYMQSLFEEDVDPDIPVITSDLEVFGPVGDFIEYQIEATNDPTGFTATLTDRGDREVQSTFDLDTGLLRVRFRPGGFYHYLVTATNEFGTGSATVEFEIGRDSGGPPPIPPPGPPAPPPTLVRLEAFPWMSSTAEDVRDECPDYALKLAAAPPSVPLNLVVITPGLPNSGVARATWTAPIRQ